MDKKEIKFEDFLINLLTEQIILESCIKMTEFNLEKAKIYCSKETKIMLGWNISQTFNYYEIVVDDKIDGLIIK